MGTTMKPTTMPAMNADEVKALASVNGRPGRVRDSEDRHPAEPDRDPVRHRDDGALQEVDPPQAEDDAGHGGHQVDEGDEKASQLAVHRLGQQQRRAQREGEADRQGDQRDGDRPEQDRCHPEVELLRCPVLHVEEGPACGPECVGGPQREEQADSQHDADGDDAGAEGRAPEDDVADRIAADDGTLHVLVRCWSLGGLTGVGVEVERPGSMSLLAIQTPPSSHVRSVRDVAYPWTGQPESEPVSR